MTEEFNLSRKFHFGDDGVFQDNGERYYLEEDVKEFIKETISDIEGGYEGEELLSRIKKRAGDKLR